MLEPILAGAVLGAVFAVAARRLGSDGELRVFAVGLAVAALIYLGLALPTAVGRWLVVETAGVTIFGGLAWLGLRRPGWLALGWAAHVAWDVALHLEQAQPVVGAWYPLACIGFDLIVAGFVLNAAVPSALRALGFAVTLLGATAGELGAQNSGQVTAPRVTNLAGARDQPGLFTQRLLLPANYCGPLHTHDHDLHGLVLRGILLMGFLDSAGTLEVRQYSAGSFVPVPAGKVHLEGSPVETEIHVSGIGPLVTTVVDSAPGLRCTSASRGGTPR
ncbi:MAG TPA: DUF6010 family protein [Gemmatimonadales bacterium]|jgi:quercetin dioxygenase-like cupin family protein